MSILAFSIFSWFLGHSEDGERKRRRERKERERRHIREEGEAEERLRRGGKQRGGKEKGRDGERRDGERSGDEQIKGEAAVYFYNTTVPYWHCNTSTGGDDRDMGLSRRRWEGSDSAAP
jgi:hypothetical protein